MKKTLLYTLAFLSALVSCNKEIKSEKGRIEIMTNVYMNASKSLDEVQAFQVARINYVKDTLIEVIPFVDNPVMIEQINFIKDSLYYDLGSPTDALLVSISDVVKQEKPRSVYTEKFRGAVFSKEKIPNYHQKRQLKDTVLFGKNYARFEINSPQSYSRFYVNKTDTILPYEIYPHAGRDFKGRIERIDSYNKEKDIFVSLQLIPKYNELDEEAIDVLKYNNYVKQRTQTPKTK